MRSIGHAGNISKQFNEIFGNNVLDMMKLN
jgi:hypothetical protein